MNDISKNIKKVLVVFLVFFIGVISYITYFEFFKADKMVSCVYNRRLQAEKNSVLRGTIYDRNNKPLTESKKLNTLHQKRTYIGGEMFSHVLGYVNPKYGMTGLEKQYDSVLTGTEHKKMDLTQFWNTMKEKKDKIGYSIKTTLDYNLQKKAYDILGTNKGSIVVMNPKTGEILAMVSKPTFDPNNLDKNWKAINKDKNIPLYNRAVLGMYPPGSTFKIITAICALENIPNITNRTFHDNGVLRFNSKESLKNYNGHVYGNLNLGEAFVKSSNVVFGGLGLELKNNNLKNASERFGFNKAIESRDISTKKSRFPTLKFYEKGNIAQSAIGQGTVLATPIEMAVVASVVANDGVMMRPYLVKDILKNNGKTLKNIHPESIREVTNSENAKIVKKYMMDTVNRGTAGNAALDYVKVCGKTGTADTGKAFSKPHSWFVGFAPYDDPKVSIAVIVENGGVGGGISTEIAGKVIDFALKVK